MHATISTTDEFFHVSSPYNPRFIAKLKGIDGRRWNGESRTWAYPATPASAAYLYNLLTSLPGWDYEADTEFLAKLVEHKRAEEVLDLNLKAEDETPTPSFEHQRIGLALLQARSGAYLAHDMGVGKSKVVIDLIDTRHLHHTLIICPKSVVPEWPIQFGRHSNGTIPCIPLFKGSVKKRTECAGKAIQNGPCALVINYEAVWREPLGSWVLRHYWDLVVGDECVPANTMISTPTGDIPIEKLKQGDTVWGMGNGTVVRSKILKTFRRDNAESLVHCNNLKLTPNHPIWTVKGYVPAKDISDLDTVGCIVLKSPQKGDYHATYPQMRMVQARVSCQRPEDSWENSPLLQPQVFCAMAHVPTQLCSKLTHAGIPQKKKRTHEARHKQPGKFTPKRYAGIRPLEQESLQRQTESQDHPSESTRSASGKGISNVARREWEAIARTSTPSSRTSRMANRIFSSDKNEKTWLPHNVQDRHSASCIKDRRRSRRTKPRNYPQGGARQEERKLAAQQGLEDIALQEQTDHGEPGPSSNNNHAGTQVYNIETSTGNYFANGLLIHNCHKIKEGRSKVSSYFNRLREKAKRRVGLSGTPMPNNPLELWAQCRFLDPGLFGLSYVAFRNRYAIMGGYGGKEVVGYRNLEDLHKKFYSLAHRVTKAEALDLPPTLDERRTAVLGAKAACIYQQLEDELEAWLEEGNITVPNAITKLLRLQQLTGGVVTLDERHEPLEVDASKSETLAEIFNNLPTSEPVVVFCRFHHDLDAVHFVAQDCYRSSVELSGRRKQLNLWRGAKEQPTVLAVQISAGSLGVDLSRACYAVYYSLGFSLGEYEQSKARLHRQGQTRSVTYIHLVTEMPDGSSTVDNKVYMALKAKQKVVDAVLEELRKDS